MKFDSLHDLFLRELGMSYDAERQILQFLPGVMDMCNNPDLKQGFQDEIKQTQERLRRIEEVYQDINQRPVPNRCKGIEGIIGECDMLINAPGVPEVKDAGFVVCGQKILHYHIAGYGSARTYARELGLNDVADLLQDNLDQLGAADKKLTKLAEGSLFSRGLNEAALNR